jgi:hypothetical protein
MKKTFIYIIIMFIAVKSISQGCVAIRTNGGYCTMQHTDSSKWQLSISNRYFRSYKHFVGTAEQEQRQTLGNEVINHQFTSDITLTHVINSRWSYMIDLPIAANSRSSLYEHSNVGRYLTHSFGVGDIRFAVYSWLADPAKAMKFNVQAGLGIKLPAGAYNYQDYFHVTDSTTRLGAVDQSIQLGDGGTGISFELNTFYNISHKLSLYGNFYYLSNPREQNGTSTQRGGTPSTNTLKNGSDVMSVADQFMFRAGATYRSNAFSVSLGVREECVPVWDLIGGSGGFRRPGYIISAEPGVNYQLKKVNLFAYVPVALVRNRTQSVPDKITTQLTGKYTQGDAAFADYSVNIGMSVKF